MYFISHVFRFFFTPLIILRSAFFSVLLTVSVFVHADVMCPQINCDCAAVPTGGWQESCVSYEMSIKLSCVQNKNQPTSYCALHGPNAFPLPLSVAENNLSTPVLSPVKEAKKYIETSFWSVNEDVKSANKDLDDGELEMMSIWLKNIDAGLDVMLKSQQELALNYVNSKGVVTKKGIKSWVRFAERSEKTSETLLELSLEVLADFEGSDNEKDKKILRDVFNHAARVSAKAFEVTGYAFGTAGAEAGAAFDWKRASDITLSVMRFETLLEGSPQQIEYYRLQAASQLHRVTYHYLLDGNLNAAKEWFSNSLELVVMPALNSTMLASEQH